MLIFLLIAAWESLKRWATIVTLPGDLTYMVDGFKWVVRAVDAWISAPPQWATIAALSVATGSYIFFLFGSDRLIRFTRLIFRKDVRLAEYKLISDDPTIAAVKQSYYAQALLNQINWNPLEPIDLDTVPTTEDGCLSEDFINTKIRRNDPVLHVENFIGQITSGHHILPVNLYLSNARKAILDAREQASVHSINWKQFEKGFSFQTERSRLEWHQHRCAVARYYGIMWEIKRHLEDVSQSWKATPSEQTVRQLLQGIDIEKLR